MLGPLRDGGIIKVSTAPGCWGPMITPSLKGGHEVTQPVYIENAELGDAVVIRINKIEVTSLATASGHNSFVQDCFIGDLSIEIGRLPGAVQVTFLAPLKKSGGCRFS